MQKVSVKNHQSHRSLLSLLPTPLLSCLDHPVSSRLPLTFSFPAILARGGSIHPSPLLTCISPYITLSEIMSLWVSPILHQKGIFILKNVFTQRQLSCCTRKQRYCLARRRGETLESLTSLARPVCMGAPWFCSLTDSTSWYF